MNKKISIGAAITFIAIAVAITITLTMFFSQGLFNEKVADLAEREAMYQKLAEVDKYIRANKLGTVDESLLTEQMVRGYVAGLGDPYAQYYTASEYAKQVSSLSGQTVGIGVTVTASDEGYIRITSVYEDSPAQAAGLQVDDLIVRVDSIDVTLDTYSKAITAIGSGEIGSTMTLMVRRQNEDFEVICTRREITQMLVSFTRFSDTVGYIRIEEFANAAVSQFDTALTELKALGMNSLILDLRQNLGGSLEAMAQIANMLLPEGEIIKAVYQTGVEKVLHRSTNESLEMPIVVLMDEYTASSSEMLIAAMIDYEKCRTVGTTTFGKNVMQEIHQFSDGSAVKITTAQLYSPLGKTYNGTGITPDYETPGNGEAILPVTLLNPETDAQLSRAIAVALDWSKSYTYPTEADGSDILMPDVAG